MGICVKLMNSRPCMQSILSSTVIDMGPSRDCGMLMSLWENLVTELVSTSSVPVKSIDSGAARTRLIRNKNRRSIQRINGSGFGGCTTPYDPTKSHSPL